MNQSRRSILQSTSILTLLVSAGVITPMQAFAADGRPAFQAKSVADAIAALGGTAASSKEITIVSPDIAENGAVVPVNVTSTIANTQEIYLLVEKNPLPLACGFIIPAGTEPSMNIRLKMGQTTTVYAIVKADGKLYSGSKDTKVTLGGCGG